MMEQKREMLSDSQTFRTHQNQRSVNDIDMNDEFNA